MQREQWMNLNGEWDYAIRPIETDTMVAADRALDEHPDSTWNAVPHGILDGEYDGKINVPFCVESVLSGVHRTVGAENYLWYHRRFSVPDTWTGKRLLLNFDAVDWRTDVWVNGNYVGQHEGGYSPFSLDITDALLPDSCQELVVRVWDPTDSGYQPRGKQVSEPRSIWYSPVTGIWQTVWLEPVNPTHIHSFCVTPDLDQNLLHCQASLSDDSIPNCLLTLTMLWEGKEVARVETQDPTNFTLEMPRNVFLWSPEHPYLYDIQVRLNADGELLDSFDSYTAMRKFSVRKDVYGYPRIQLNDETLFQFGVLDQGYWPDGLYTPASDQALLFDIQQAKTFGFNMIRKHLKVELARWYSYCDRMGMIVWQDMPNSDIGPAVDNKLPTQADHEQRSQASRQNHRREWQEIMDNLKRYPCICTWVVFNEAMGQFDTEDMTRWTQAYDSTRLVDAASGGNYYFCGDILDTHHYPNPTIRFPNNSYVQVEGEFGGLGFPIEEHMWLPDDYWSYQGYSSADELARDYTKHVNALYSLKSRGLSAAVYTQLTDVEREINGLLTYDRKVCKIDPEYLHFLNQHVIHESRAPKDDEFTAVKSQSSPSAEIISIHTPDGIEISRKQAGLNLIRYADGAVRKEMVP